jgi:hypothetical protein
MSAICWSVSAGKAAKRLVRKGRNAPPDEVKSEGGATSSLPQRTNPLTQLLTTDRHQAVDRDRALAAVVALTTYCANGGAIRSKLQGYLRRDWLMFAPALPGGGLPADAEPIARDLKCDLIAVQLAEAGTVPTLSAGMRLWGRTLWRGGLRLWRDDTGGRCCLVPQHDIDLHLWLEAGRIVAVDGLPWRDTADRDLGYARAAAAYRRMIREA